MIPSPQRTRFAEHHVFSHLLMYFRELRKIARPHWFDILFAIKQSTGLSVTKLAKSMRMSYMGVKQHCDDLEKLGYLDTWRQPRKKGGGGGRPEKLYRLTERAHIFFPSFGNELTTDLLASVREAYGANAPEKLIFAYLAKKAGDYRKHLASAGSLFERANAFVVLRNREGLICVCEEKPDHVEIQEYHHPLREIFENYPATVRMEQNMIEQTLGCSVRRQTEDIAGLTRTLIHLHPR